MTYRGTTAGESSDDAAGEYSFTDDDASRLSDIDLGHRIPESATRGGGGGGGVMNNSVKSFDEASSYCQNQKKNRRKELKALDAKREPESAGGLSRYETSRSCSIDMSIGGDQDLADTAPPPQETKGKSASTASTTFMKVPRVPTANKTTLALTEATRSSVTTQPHLNRKEKLLHLLRKVARKEAGGKEEFYISQRTKKLVQHMLEQDAPLLFYAHLIELVQVLGGHGDSQMISSSSQQHSNNREMSWNQMLIVLNALSSTLLEKQKGSAAGEPPRGRVGGLFGKKKAAAGPSTAEQASFGVKKIRALLALESLTHNCPERFASIFLEHPGIHHALTFIVSSFGDVNSSKGSPKDDLYQVQKEAFAIAKRMLDWSAYSKSAGGTLIRKWCRREVDKLYMGQLKSLYNAQVRASCSLCQMSKWEWLADVEEAAVTIQSHFRSYLVRREMARRRPYGMSGPFTSRVFPMYRRNAAQLEAHSLEETGGKHSQTIYPLDMLDDRILHRRRQTNSSLSTVGESLMSQLPLEQIFLQEKEEYFEKGKQAMYNLMDRGKPSPFDLVETRARRHQRVSDSDYDSGTEYAASSRVTIKPRSHIR